jgi:hypothetical protein
MKAIFEVDMELDSVVVWEAGVGHRIIYTNPNSAEIAYYWLCTKSATFHKAKEETGAAAIECYGEIMSPYEFIRHYLSVCTSAGHRVYESTLSRQPAEFW